jgi:hypothetical protein
MKNLLIFLVFSLYITSHSQTTICDKEFYSRVRCNFYEIEYVCGTLDDGTQQTFNNACVACAGPAVSITNGQCPAGKKPKPKHKVAECNSIDFNAPVCPNSNSVCGRMNIKCIRAPCPDTRSFNNLCEACQDNGLLEIVACPAPIYTIPTPVAITSFTLCDSIDISVIECTFNEYVCGEELDGSLHEFNNVCEACRYSNIFGVSPGGCTFPSGQHPVADCNTVDYNLDPCPVSNQVCGHYDVQSGFINNPFTGLREYENLCEACKLPGLKEVEYDMCQRYGYDPVLNFCKYVDLSSCDFSQNRPVCANEGSSSVTYKNSCYACQDPSHKSNTFMDYPCKGRENYKTCDDLDFTKSVTCTTNLDICVHLSDGTIVTHNNPCTSCSNYDVLFYELGACS